MRTAARACKWPNSPPKTTPATGLWATVARVEVEPEQLLEDVFDGFASALEYLGGTFDGANSDVLAGLCGAFAQIACSVNGMQRHQVSGGFPRSFSCAAGAFCKI